MAIKNQSLLVKILLFSILFLVLWLPRGLALDRFVTADEPKWLLRSAHFYQELYNGDFKETFQQSHPGVTITGAGTVGFLWRFPGYVKVAQNQLVGPTKFQKILNEYNFDVLEMLKASRFLIVLVIVTTLGLSMLFFIKLVGLIPALVGFLLIAFDPFSLGLSRLLHLDALLSAFILLSLLSYMNYLYQGPHFYNLIIASIASGLAWLTKSPSFFLIPFFSLLSLIEFGRSWWSQRQLSLRYAWHITWPVLAWAGIAAMVFVLLWPAMWVDPLGSLQEVFGEAITYAAEGHYSATFFNGKIFEEGISDWRFYPVSYLWRTTPPILIGLLFAGIALIFRRKLSFPKEQQRTTLVLLLFALLYMVFMTLGTKKFDRYLLPIFAPLALVAGIGWVVMIKNALYWATNRWDLGSKASDIARFGTMAILILILLLQFAGAVTTFPYYLSYYNPLMGGAKMAPGVMMIGWGEGLDLAAQYLNSKPNFQDLEVQSWYPNGPFSYIFNGKTIYDNFETDPKDLMKEADYYVLYYHQWQRQLPSKEFIQYFDQMVPEHIVYIDGLEYVRIYHRDAMKPNSQSD